MALNKVILMGRLTEDPRLRATGEVTVASFSLAVERDFKNRETGQRTTDFFDVIAWRGAAEFATRYLKKGQLAAVEGRLQIREWADWDGSRRRKAEIAAERVYFGEAKPKTAEAEKKDDGPPADPDGPPLTPIDEDDGDLPF